MTTKLQTTRGAPSAGWLSITALLILFLGPRLWLVLHTSGSFVDEYWHLVSATDLLEHGHLGDFDTSPTYKRGAFLSVWLAGWISILGKSVAAAKISVLLFGLGSFVAVVSVARHEIEHRSVLLLLGAMLALSPWLIFDHIYIRMYVFYEFVTCLCVWLLHVYCRRIDSNEAVRRPYRILIWIAAILTVLLLTSFDSGAYAPALVVGLMLGFLFVFHPNYLLSLGRIPGAVALASPARRLVVLILLAGIGVLALDIWPKVQALLSGDMEYGASRGQNYRIFLFEENAVVSTLMGVSVLTMPWARSPFLRALIVSVALVFGIHLLTADKAQVLRGIFYLLPLYYFVAALALDQMRFPKAAPAILAFALAIAYSFMDQYPRDFLSRPSAPGINYVDYRGAYEFVREHCQGRDVIDASPGVHVAEFHDVLPSSVLIFEGSSELSDDMFVGVNGAHRTHRSSVPVIYSLPASPVNVCVVVREPSRARFVSAADEEILAKASEIRGFHNISVYRF